ncbi:MAG: gliding motility-associated ABC transporter substrate-binding protein GldG [Bacteroidetes bacterium]|nr:gliding motility-associated ABC transporter substrate-binding protein GldG [Bacteroidota bacterium]MBS1758248.1 gliding motility-associated ABC transporter substrate-binding protein GldG [Bacteroidota bacterium]
MAVLKKIWGSKLWIVMVLAFLLLINWAASLYHTRADLTNEKRFTLSEPTKKLLKKIDGQVSIDVFLKGDFPSGFKKLSASSSDILKEFKEIAGSSLTYQFISPDDVVAGTSEKWGDTLSAEGLIPINLTSQVKEGQQQQFVYPYALVHYQGQIIPVVLYQGKTAIINFQELNSAEAMLEFNFADAIAKAIQKQKPIVGYAIGNGEPSPGEYRAYDLFENVLRPNYRLFTFNPNTQPLIPDEFKVLMVVKPTEGFTDEAKFKLDQYVMNGGKLLLFIDKLNAEMDSLQIKNEVIAYDRNLQLSDLLFKYGVRINPDLVMDLQCDYLPFDVNGNGQFDFLPWNYFPVFESKSNNPINKNLGFVAGKFVNSIDTVEADGIEKTILLSSSANARRIGTPALISGKENVNAPEDAKFKTPNIPVAVLLQGKFTSLFANRLSQSMNDTLQKYQASFMPQCLAPNKLIVVADGDMVLNAVVKGNQPLPMGMNQYTFGSRYEIPFANKQFLQNCLDYLINENNLSDAKSKDYVLRLLNAVKVKEEKTTWQLINIVAPVLLVIIFAFIFQWWRKRKYAH